MKCKDCKYHSYVGGTHFCDSRNHKRKTVRIDEDDAQKDIACKWADLQKYPVTPSRHKGHWLRITTVNPKEFCNRCSECGYEQFYAERYKFCPNCGAEMESEE